MACGKALQRELILLFAYISLDCCWINYFGNKQMELNVESQCSHAAANWITKLILKFLKIVWINDALFLNR